MLYTALSVSLSINSAEEFMILYSYGSNSKRCMLYGLTLQLVIQLSPKRTQVMIILYMRGISLDLKPAPSSVFHVAYTASLRADWMWNMGLYNQR